MKPLTWDNRASQTPTRRHILQAAGMVAAFSAMSACSSQKSGAAASATSTVRLSVGVDPTYAPVYLAKDKGMFDDAGIQVEVIQVEGGAAALENVVAGTSDMSINADATALPILAQKSNVKAIANFESSSTLFKVVLRKGVTPKEIHTMVAFPGLGEYMTEKYLHSIGKKASDVKVTTRLTRNARETRVVPHVKLPA